MSLFSGKPSATSDCSMEGWLNHCSQPASSNFFHVATVKKSRVWAPNGKSFAWRDQPAYKPGYFQQIGECFKPHFESINIGGVHHVTDQRPGSGVLFVQGSDQSYHELQIRREIAIEKWDATMDLIAPGRKEENMRRRLLIGEAITNTRSKTEFERQALDCIEEELRVLVLLEQQLRDNPAKDDAELQRLLDCAVTATARREEEKDRLTKEHSEVVVHPAPMAKPETTLSAEIF